MKPRTNPSRNVLVTCGGKWAGFILQMREAMRKVPPFSSARIFVASSERVTPAGHFADAAFHVPLIREESYIPTLEKLCFDNDVGLLIPLIDLDLEALGPHVPQFGKNGTKVLCPDQNLTELCFDKLHFAQFARRQSLPILDTRLFPDLGDLIFPLFYKRRRGFGSIGSGICRTHQDAADVAAADPSVIFQPKVDAPEVTVDAYISQSGRCIVRVPRLREKVLAGEAVRSRTVRFHDVTALADRTLDALGALGFRGPLNIQMFLTSPPTLIEVNARYGSASVLSNQASFGRLFSAALIESSGGIAEGDPDDFSEGLSLYRFFGDVFFREDQVLTSFPS